MAVQCTPSKTHNVVNLRTPEFSSITSLCRERSDRERTLEAELTASASMPARGIRAQLAMLKGDRLACSLRDCEERLSAELRCVARSLGTELQKLELEVQQFPQPSSHLRPSKRFRSCTEQSLAEKRRVDGEHKLTAIAWLSWLHTVSQIRQRATALRASVFTLSFESRRLSQSVFSAWRASVERTPQAATFSYDDSGVGHHIIGSLDSTVLAAVSASGTNTQQPCTPANTEESVCSLASHSSTGVNMSAWQQRLREVEAVLASRDPALASLIARLATGVLGELGTASAALMEVQQALSYRSHETRTACASREHKRHQSSRRHLSKKASQEEPSTLLLDPMRPLPAGQDDRITVQSSSLMRTSSRRLEPFVRERVKHLGLPAISPEV